MSPSATHAANTTESFATVRDLEAIQKRESLLPALSPTARKSLYPKEHELPRWSPGADAPLITRLHDKFGGYKSNENPFIIPLSRQKLNDKDHRNYLAEKWCLNRAFARLEDDFFDEFDGKCDNLIPGSCSRGDASKIKKMENRRGELASRRFYELCRIDSLLDSSSEGIGIGGVGIKNILRQNIHCLLDVPSITNELKLPQWDNLALQFEDFVELTVKLRDSLISCLVGGVFCQIFVC